MAKLEEITVTYVSERFRKDKFGIHIVREAGKQFSALGESEPGEFQAHLDYRLWGTWDRTNEKFGPQFKFKTFVVAQPHGRQGIIVYLQNAPHIGPVIAGKLFNAFGAEAVRTLRERPDIAADAVGSHFSLEQAEEAAKWLGYAKSLENATIELTDLLHGRGFPKAAIKKAIELWGNKAPEILRRDPFRSLVFRGVGFKRADAFYMDLGKPPGKLKRQAYCLLYTATSDSDSQGHTWIPIERAYDQLKAHIGGVNVTPEKALTLARRAGILKVRTEGEQTWVSDCRRADNERYVCEKITEAMYEDQIGTNIAIREHLVTTREVRDSFTRCFRCHRKLEADTVAVFSGQPFGPDCIQRECPDRNGYITVPLSQWLDEHTRIESVVQSIAVGVNNVRSVVPWPDMSHKQFCTLSDHQRDMLSLALQGPICIFGGAPGTGKTYTVARLVDAITAKFGPQSIAVAAPTGKAAVRCTQAMRDNGIGNFVARTVHGMLGVEVVDEGGWSFKYREGNPLPFKFLIIDEVSMMSTALMASLLAARARGTGLLLVGDVNQLPPVEYGAPLRDLIDVGLPYGELREIRRNCGTIVKACAAIRDGEPFPIDGKLDLDCDPPNNLILMTAPKATAQSKVIQCVENLRDRSPFDATWQAQVCVAVNKRSPLSRQELNKLLQPKLNKAEPEENTNFRLGDKVIQLKNGFFSALNGGDEDKVFVANGEIGKILEIHKNKLVVDFTIYGSDLPEGERKIVIIPKFTASKESDSENESDQSSTGCDMDLAYAVTTHKMQGSGVPVAVVVLDEYPGASGPHGVCDRAWLFTAISRAEKACILIGTTATLQAIVSKQFIWRRKTFMREILRELCAEWGVALHPRKAELTTSDLF